MKSIPLALLLILPSLALAQSKPYSSKPYSARPYSAKPERSSSDLRAGRALKVSPKAAPRSSATTPPSTLKTTSLDQQLDKLAKKNMAAAKDSSRKASRPAPMKLPKTETASAANKPITFGYQKPKAGPSAVNKTGGARRGPSVRGRSHGSA